MGLGDFGRRIGACIAAIGLALAIAGTARASEILAAPSFAGSGSLGGVGCAMQVPPSGVTNSDVTTCQPMIVSAGSTCVFQSGNGCLITKYFGVSLVIPAVPDTGWKFDHWELCASPDGPVCTATIPTNLDGPITLKEAPTAFFEEIVPVSVTSGPPAFTSSKTAAVTYSTSTERRPGDTLTFRCQLDDGPQAPCPANGQFANLADGPHTITVWGVHNGDPSLTPAVSSFTVDTAAPTVALDPTSGPGQGAVQAIDAETFKFSSSEPGTPQCSLDAAAFSGCASPVTVDPLSAGAHSFRVRTIDRAGNVSVIAERDWTVAAVAALPPAAIPAAVPSPPVITVTVPFTTSSLSATTTRFTRLAVAGVPAGATVTVACLSRSCPAALLRRTRTQTVKRELVLRTQNGTVDLKRLISKPLRAGTKLEVRVTKPGSVGAVKVITVNKRTAPTVSTQCLPPGAKKPGRC
jgi:hypothetical protein